MICPHCQHSDIPDASTRCPHCDQALGQPPVIEAELVDESQTSSWSVHQQSQRQSFQDGQGQRYSRVFYTSFPGNAQTDKLSQSCMVSLVMLALTLGAGFQYGFLAALGFLVFAGIGRAVTFVIFMRRLLEGRPISVWALHGLTWLVCWLLVAWLSGGLD